MPQIDPRIALETRVPQMPDTMQTLGSLAQIQDRRQMQQEHAAVTEQKQRALEDDAAERSALQQYPDPDQAINALYRAGRANVAGSLSKKVLAEREAKTKAYLSDLDLQKKAVEFNAQVFSGVDSQQTLDSARAVAEKTLPKHLMQFIPTVYDKVAVKKVVDFGLSAAERLTQQHQAFTDDIALQNLKLAKATHADAHAASVTNVYAKQREIAAAALATAGNQQELDNIERHFAMQDPKYVPIMAEFGNKWTPDFGKRVREMAMAPAQQATEAHAKVTEQQGAARLKVEQDREARESGKGPGGAVTPNRESEVLQWKANQYRDMEKQIHPVDPVSGQPIKNDDLPADAKAMFGQRKLQIENAARAMMRQPPLEEAEIALSADPSTAKELRKVRNTYRMVTGQDAPLERQEKLLKAIKAEHDPTKAAALRTQLKALRDQSKGQPPQQPDQPEQ